MPIRLTFVSGRETEYVRNAVVVQALRRAFEVNVVHAHTRSIVLNTLSGVARALGHGTHANVVFVGFLGQPAALLLRPFLHVPMILDAYVSVYETLCDDRRLVPAHSWFGRALYWMERLSLRAARLVVTDTKANAEFLAQRFKLPRAHIEHVYVGCDERVFSPMSPAQPKPRHVRVFTYNSFLPLHGNHVLLQAASLLKHRSDIKITIGGDGKEATRIRQEAQRLALPNVEFIGWIPYAELPKHIAESDICLGGHFSLIPKAARVIATKTYQFLAMRRPVIVGDGVASREVFAHGETAWLVKPGDPHSLAEGIETLADNPRLRSELAAAGRDLFKRTFTLDAISQRLRELVERVCASV